MLNRICRSICHYETLGISRSADSAAIKSAYYDLVKIHHPDTEAADDSTKFQEIQEAYETLIDDDNRYEYDLGQGYLNAMDIDRLETLKEEYGSRYLSPDFWERLKQADQDLADKVYVQK